VDDGAFEVLRWLPFPSAVPPVPLLTALCVTVKVLPDISAISALTAVKHGSYSSLTPPLNPVNRLLLMWILCLLQKRISLKPVGLTMIFFCPGMTSCEQKKNLKEWLNHSEIALAGRKDSDFEF
jgi:hypothetical protein